MAFLIEETLERLEKEYLIREADEEDVTETPENEDENSSQESEDETSADEEIDKEVALDPTKAETDVPAEDDAPEDQAAPEQGTFISDNRKAEIAKSMLDALMASPPEQGTIPTELLNVTIDNADKVIEFVQGSLNVQNETDVDNILDQLKNSN